MVWLRCIFATTIDKLRFHRTFSLDPINIVWLQYSIPMHFQCSAICSQRREEGSRKCDRVKEQGAREYGAKRECQTSRVQKEIGTNTRMCSLFLPNFLLCVSLSSNFSSLFNLTLLLFLSPSQIHCVFSTALSLSSLTTNSPPPSLFFPSRFTAAE